MSTYSRISKSKLKLSPKGLNDASPFDLVGMHPLEDGEFVFDFLLVFLALPSSSIITWPYIYFKGPWFDDQILV